LQASHLPNTGLCFSGLSVTVLACIAAASKATTVAAARAHCCTRLAILTLPPKWGHRPLFYSGVVCRHPADVESAKSVGGLSICLQLHRYTGLYGRFCCLGSSSAHVLSLPGLRASSPTAAASNDLKVPSPPPSPSQTNFLEKFYDVIES